MLQASGAAAGARESTEEYQDVVFLQVRGEQSALAPALRKRAIAELTKAAKDQKSLALSALVTQLAKDPFAKVKVLIQQLIERLLTEATNEATHKGWCDTEMGKAEKDREFRHADTTKINALVTDSEANIAGPRRPSQRSRTSSRS